MKITKKDFNNKHEIVTEISQKKKKEKKDIKREDGRNRFEDMSEEYKPKLKE